MSLQMIHSDITKLKCDVIVNPTDPVFSHLGGTDKAIHTAAGPELAKECEGLPSLCTGSAVATKGYNLCKYVIHTVGPVWQDGEHDEPVLLRSCYINCLLLASELKAKSIAFPLISAGIFGFPKDRVLQIALDAIRSVLNLMGNELDVILCVFDPQAYKLSHAEELQKYLDEPLTEKIQTESERKTALSEWLSRQTESFPETLKRLIKEKGMTNVDCYKKANIKKQTFSKIRNDPQYTPQKETVLALAIALELTLEETVQLLKTVGLSLSGSNQKDKIFEFYLKNRIYNIYEIDSALVQYDQKCLFSEE